MRGRRRDRPTPQWTRAKLLALVVGGCSCALLLLTGLVLAAFFAIAHDEGAGSAAERRVDGSASRAGRAGTAADPKDTLAARAMPRVDPDASHPGSVSTKVPKAPIDVPAATTVGAARVPSGYPRTPSGALAQLAAIDRVALESGSLAGAREVIAAWALPGGPTAGSWSGLRALAQFYDAAGLSGGGSNQLALVVTPLMGLIKGSVGPDFVVPCVDFVVEVTLQQTSRGAIADCQRMQWTGHRWMVAPGFEPDDPPSVWPDTDRSYDVGYRDLRQETSR